MVSLNPPNEDPWHPEFAARLRGATAGTPLREIAQRTGTNYETVRRHLLNGRVPGLFVSKVCRAFNVRPEWLLHGRGVMRD